MGFCIIGIYLQRGFIVCNGLILPALVSQHNPQIIIIIPVFGIQFEGLADEICRGIVPTLLMMRDTKQMKRVRIVRADRKYFLIKCFSFVELPSLMLLNSRAKRL